MVCLHRNGDPNCGSSRSYVPEPKTPDAEKYTIEDATRVGSHLVLKVKYPNCASCAYEGVKVLVYLNITELVALKWKIDHDQWYDPSNPKEGINIEAGDRIQVTWPDKSRTIHRLEIYQYTFVEDRDNGYGKWWKHEIDVRRAYFTYDYRGITHKVSLRSDLEKRGIKWKRLLK